MKISSEQLPPGPRMPRTLQLLHWIFRPIPFMEACQRRYGDWFTVGFRKHMTFVFTSEPEAVKEIFTEDAGQLSAGEANQILKPLLGENSLLLLDGARHFQERRLMMPPFHGERMPSYGRIMREVADRAMDGWPVGRAFPLHPQMQSITLDVILRTVFGIGEHAALSNLRLYLKETLSLASQPMVLMMMDRRGEVRWPRLHGMLGARAPLVRITALMDKVDRVIFSEIEQRRASANENRQDILSLLAGARTEEGRTLSRQELRDELMTLLIAGHETTATSLCWVFYRLLNHRSVLERVRSEIQQVAGNGPVEPEHIGHLPYLDAAIKETLRLNPIVPIVGRCLRSAMRLGSRRLPAGVIVAPCIYLTHRRPDLWPEPERFEPERFLGHRPSPHEFFPFGGGSRRCLGMAFASYEMKMILAQILSRVDLRLPQGYTAKVVRRGITFAPSERMPVVMESIRDAGGGGFEPAAALS